MTADGSGSEEDWVERTAYDKETGQYYPYQHKLNKYELAVRDSWLKQLERSNEFQQSVSDNFEKTLRRAALTYHQSP